MLRYSGTTNSLHRDQARFDPWALAWVSDAAVPPDSREISALDAVAWLFSQPKVRQVAVGVIGPREASSRQIETAERVGRRLGELGVQMICGGRSGVMEAAFRGNLTAGGRPIGILPGDEWSEANPYVAIPLATGLGVARNAVIARAAVALIAIGGGHGTLSEMAFGLHFDRLVMAQEGAPEVTGALRMAVAEEALARVALRLLALDC